MPAFQVQDRDTYRVALKFTHRQQNCQTGWHMMENNLAAVSAQSVLDQVKPWVDAHFLLMLNSFMQMRAIEVFHLTSGDFARFTYSGANGSHGPSTAPAPHEAIGIQLRSNSRYRHRNGAMRWPCRDGGDRNGEVLTASAVEFYTARLTAWVDDMIGLPGIKNSVAVVVSNSYNNADQENPQDEANLAFVSAQTIATAVLNRNITTQNTRKVGRGA